MTDDENFVGVDSCVCICLYACICIHIYLTAQTIMWYWVAISTLHLQHTTILHHTASPVPHCNNPDICDGNFWYKSATHCNTLQHIATHYNTLNQSATILTFGVAISDIHLPQSATYCSTFQCTASRCNKLHYVATQLRHTVTILTHRVTISMSSYS